MIDDIVQVYNPAFRDFHSLLLMLYWLLDHWLFEEREKKKRWR